MADRDVRIWEWRKDPVTGKRKLVRIGPWKNLFYINWWAMLAVACILLSYGYVQTANSECQALLHNPELYCPCLDDVPVGVGEFNLSLNVSVSEVGLADGSNFVS